MGKHKCLLETERFLGLSIPEKTLPKSKNGNDEQIEIIQSLDENQIETILLERYPALLIAKAVHLTVDGEDCLLAAAPVRLDRCEGHFPGMPVLPLAVAAQAAGQACGILAKLMSSTARRK